MADANKIWAFMFGLPGHGRLNHLRRDEVSLKLDVGKRM